MKLKIKRFSALQKTAGFRTMNSKQDTMRTEEMKTGRNTQKVSE
jgi:hypothetical protein